MVNLFQPKFCCSILEIPSSINLNNRFIKEKTQKRERREEKKQEPRLVRKIYSSGKKEFIELIDDGTQVGRLLCANISTGLTDGTQSHIDCHLLSKSQGLSIKEPISSNSEFFRHRHLLSLLAKGIKPLHHLFFCPHTNDNISVVRAACSLWRQVKFTLQTTDIGQVMAFIDTGSIAWGPVKNRKGWCFRKVQIGCTAFTQTWCITTLADNTLTLKNFCGSLFMIIVILLLK